MNIDENFLGYVEERLDQWAKWFSEGNSYGMGYSPCSIEYRLMTVGIINKSSGPKPLAYNEEAEEIESLICELAKQDKLTAEVLRYHYLQKGSFRDKSKAFNISHNQFSHFVDMAHHWLAGRLTAIVKYHRQ